MQSIERIKASDGSGNASVATVQNTRIAPATTIHVDTVAGINVAGFEGSMGTPHTFTDPVTSEVITVISEDTAVDFSGHVDGVNLEIDDIAPGYVDGGSAIGDIVIIRPTTAYADNIAAVLAQEHNDDGTHSDITADSINATSGVFDSLEVNGVAGADGYTPLGATPSSVVNQTGGWYDLVFGSDITASVSEGMILKVTRTVTAPVKCTSLNGTTQFWNKTSPAGMTFTDDFVVGVWFKLNAYNTGTQQAIASRYNGTSGWTLRVGTSGAIEFIGYNAGAANNSVITSQQVVPVNRWVYLVAELDMSSFSNSATTSYIMFNGVNVPGTVSRAGTNPTALVQAGNFEIGSTNGGTLPFNGKISQLAIFNAKVTQATMRTYQSQGLAGSETSLISYYSFNNTANDGGPSGNNLTANGSAVATNADAPFGMDTTLVPTGNTEYCRVFAVTAPGGNTTLSVLCADGCAIPTSGGVSAISFSKEAYPLKAPVGKIPRMWATKRMSSLSLSTSAATVASIGVPVVAGKTYKINISYSNATNVATGGVNISGVDDGTNTIFDAYGPDAGTGFQVGRAATGYYQPTTTGIIVFTWKITKSAGTATLNAGSGAGAVLTVEEIPAY